MAAEADLHKALSNLSPLNQSILPQSSDESSVRSFLEDAFVNAAFIVDTIPIPPPPNTTGNRPRSATTSSTASTLSVSAARPPAPDSSRAAFTKEWKEVKPGGQNPHDIKVYKLSSKDGNGAWFARRSVHEGIGYTRFRKGLRREFEEGLKQKEGREDEGMIIPQGVRGIGAEKRVERLVAKGVGRVDVYHLSAQFPGPSAPRDFVTACMTSSRTFPAKSTSASCTSSGHKGREFTMVSRPISHDGAPEQNGFVRGKYESIEFIREIVPDEDDTSAPKRTMSAIDLRTHRSGAAKADTSGRRRSRTVGEPGRRSPDMNGSGVRDREEEDVVTDSGKQLDGANSSTPSGQEGEDDDSIEDEDDGETNPVEWIMLTRSDPGGSVPRFMVERGTPGSILKDAEKFLNWALDKEHHDDLSDDEHYPEKIDEDDDAVSGRERSTTTSTTSSSITVSSTGSTLGAISDDASNLKRAMSNDDSTSNLSFKTASSGDEGDFDQANTPSISSSQNSGRTNTLKSVDSEITPNRHRSMTQSSATLQKIRDDAIKMTEKLKSSRDKDEEKVAKEMAKEEERQRRLAEKHARDAAKREEKFKRDQAKAEEKKRREEEKIRERKRKLEEKDVEKRHEWEKQDLRNDIEILRKENSALHDENERLVKELEALKLQKQINSPATLTPLSQSSSHLGAPPLPPRSVSPSSSSIKSKGSIDIKG